MIKNGKRFFGIRMFQQGTLSSSIKQAYLDSFRLHVLNSDRAESWFRLEATQTIKCLPHEPSCPALLLPKVL